MTIPRLSEILLLLATGVAVGPVVAFVCEKWSWFQSLPTGAKGWLVFGLCMLLPPLAWLVLLAMAYEPSPASWQLWIEALWAKLATGFVVWSASQGSHVVFDKYLTKSK